MAAIASSRPAKAEIASESRQRAGPFARRAARASSISRAASARQISVAPFSAIATRLAIAGPKCETAVSSVNRGC
jgi:hypothetical protein